LPEFDAAPTGMGLDVEWMRVSSRSRTKVFGRRRKGVFFEGRTGSAERRLGEGILVDSDSLALGHLSEREDHANLRWSQSRRKARMKNTRSRTTSRCFGFDCSAIVTVGLENEGEEWDRLGKLVVSNKDLVVQDLTLGTSGLRPGVDEVFAVARTSNWRAT